MKPQKFADCHVHIEEDYRPESAVKLLDTLKSCGVTNVCLLGIPMISTAENLVCLYQKDTYKSLDIAAFAGLYQSAYTEYGCEPYELQLEKALAMGFDGIKFLEEKPNYRKAVGKGINHSDYDAMFELAEKKNVPVLIHCSDPRNFWTEEFARTHPDIVKRGWFFGDGTYNTYEQLHDETLERIAKHPGIRFVLAHFFFVSDNKDFAVKVMEQYPNVSFDLTPGGEMYLSFSEDIDFWHDFFIKYQDRILFGTDSNAYKDFNDKLNELVYTALSHDKSDFHMPTWGDYDIKGLELPEKVIEKICYGNYAKFIGKTNPINRDMLYGECEKMLDFLCEKVSEPGKYAADIAFLKEILK